MFLSSTSQFIEALLAGPVVSEPVACWVDFVDVRQADGVALGPDTAHIALPGSSPLVLVPAPDTSGLCRELLHLTAHNADSAPAALTVRLNDLGVLVPGIVVTLQPGDTLFYDVNQGWKVIDTAGTVKVVAATAVSATQSGSWGVAVTNLPTIQAVSGAVEATQAGPWGMLVTNLPAVQEVSGVVQAIPDGTFPVSGVFWPATQAVSGTASVFPAATFPVSGAFFPTTQAVSGSVAVTDFPAVQQVSGSVSIVGFPSVFGPAGSGSANGLVPAPGGTAHPNFPYYLGDDGVWRFLPGGLLGYKFTAAAESTSSTGSGGVDLTTPDSLTFFLDVSGTVSIRYSSQSTNPSVSNNYSDLYVDGVWVFSAIATIYIGGNFTPNVLDWSVALLAGSHIVDVKHHTPGGTGTWSARRLEVSRVG